ncbi:MULTISPECIES: MMPL family transporter [unclassified Pseudomonas]|uniref:efflux RND transporter permease subunit n=1 Tax=unclassified Pseudomonas TaxID=196821 RepID=UPI002AC98A20|nr:MULTISPECIES: MMPL family transporter [unclassified Pseudomonas]MEB0039298.1 MMPL family transporter [Pseudomonas sp. MH10]MEB0076054.1 MMPL family transporter [Pseudomonas sp. MH10out]MEB0100145.1 MMPL family transporter [Pseudomonas sp. CCI3.2]MEB0119737.1 MMPL family transporter [Pseudomonas sp. CCI1.2]MEB0131481.1 MMPL family transporter [Pseudomonas sp. CCI2.4]
MNAARQIQTPPNLTNRLVAGFERYLFGHRILVLALFLLVSLLLGYAALSLRPDASFSRMIPVHHPFVVNYLKFEDVLRPQSNVLRVVVENPNGDIFNKAFLDTLREVNDAIFFIPGVDRGNLKSLWTPNALWAEVTTEGIRSGRVIPDNYDGGPQALAQVRQNILRANMLGSFVANDFRSVVIRVPLLENDPQSGKPLDYGVLAHDLEKQVRAHFDARGVHIRVIGFAQIISDLLAAAADIALFFAITVGLITLLLYGYCRCWRSTAVTVLTCLLTVVCQLGLLSVLGLGLDPYSILVPFLIFAIGISHAVQNINLMMSEIGQGASPLQASRRTFRALFLPGSTALLADAVGFITLMVIDIGVIQQLAITASIGVFVALFTKMFLLPVLMSYVGVSPGGLRKQQQRLNYKWPVFTRLARVCEPRFAWPLIVASLLLLGYGYHARQDLKIGDLDKGAPEFRPEARYNQDNAYLLNHYTTSTDVYVVIFKTPQEQCARFAAADLASRFERTMREVPGVESVQSLYNAMRFKIMASNEGNPKWAELSRDPYVMNTARAGVATEFINSDCSVAPISLYLADHKAQTLTAVANAVQTFANANNTGGLQLLQAAGNAGIEAATNIVIGHSEKLMLILVFLIISAVVWWEFRSLKVAFALMAPLYLSTVLCEAVMAKMGLGVKIATLPVIALGVGIGVDYGIYLYSRIEGFLRQGLTLQESFLESLKTTGTSIVFTALTLAVGVATWSFSSLKFQADMGVLLVLLFIWNMIGTLVLTPALASVLIFAKRR